MELLKLLSTSEVVAQVLSFLILFFILRVFFWKRFLKLLDDRKERIAFESKKIEDERNKAEELKAQYLDKLKSIEDTAKSKIQEAALEGQKMLQQMKSDARTEAEKIINDAKDDVKREFSKAKQELRDEVVDLVLEATEHLLEEKINDKEDRRIVKNFLDRLDEV